MTLSREVWNKVRRIQIRTSRAVTDLFAGAYHSTFRGRGMQFEDVREYQPGDDVRAIDWNVTARMQYPYIKNFREERELTVMLVVDVSASCLFGSHGQRKQDRLTEIGAVLALSAVRNHDKVGLLLFSDRIERYIAPKKGTNHVLRLIRELLVAKPAGEGTDVAVALQYLARVQPRRGVCFLMSDFIIPPCERALTLAARRYDLTGICLTDGSEIDFPNAGILSVRDLESGRRVLVDTSQPAVREQLRRRALSRIAATRELAWRAGAAFVDLRTHADYVAQLQQAFERRDKKNR